jgi:hypothetical protein
MNGDDGYVDGGGGGSVWWEVAVSEGRLRSETKGEFTEVCPDNRFNPHRPPQANHGRYMVTGHDSFRESSARPEDGIGYFEITIFDARTIHRFELDQNGRTLRIYVPIADANKDQPQYKVSWGLRREMVPLSWDRLKAALESAAASAV